MNDNKQLAHDFLTIAEVHKYLNISLSAAYTLSHRKDFPTCRFGGAIRIPRAAFLAWIELHSHMTDQLRGAM